MSYVLQSPSQLGLHKKNSGVESTRIYLKDTQQIKKPATDKTVSFTAPLHTTNLWLAKKIKVTLLTQEEKNGYTHSRVSSYIMHA